MFYHSFPFFFFSPLFSSFFHEVLHQILPCFSIWTKIVWGGGWPEYISLIFFVTSDLPSSLRHCLTYLLNLPPYLLPTFRFFTPSVDLPFSLLSVSAPLITIFSCLLYFFLLSILLSSLSSASFLRLSLLFSLLAFHTIAVISFELT